MPNVSRINGFRVINDSAGGNKGVARLYYVASAADEILAGDIVKLGGSADANGIPTADLCLPGDVPCGVVVAVLHSRFDPDGKMTSGSVALDLPNVAQIPASGAGYILVNDDPHVMLEAETSNGTIAVANFGQNIQHANGTRTAATITSTATLDVATAATTSTHNFQILGLVRRVDNEVGASARLRVRFNRHQYNSVGTTGI